MNGKSLRRGLAVLLSLICIFIFGDMPRRDFEYLLGYQGSVRLGFPPNIMHDKNVM